jgi:hypothetical protein
LVCSRMLRPLLMAGAVSRRPQVSIYSTYEWRKAIHQRWGRSRIGLVKLDLNWSISFAFAQIPGSFQSLLSIIFVLEVRSEHGIHAFGRDRRAPLQKRLWRFWNHMSRWQGVCCRENTSRFGWPPKQRRSPPVPCSHYKNKITRNGGCVGEKFFPLVVCCSFKCWIRWSKNLCLALGAGHRLSVTLGSC